MKDYLGLFRLNISLLRLIFYKPSTPSNSPSPIGYHVTLEWDAKKAAANLAKHHRRRLLAHRKGNL
jgi:hypothetical protein